MKTERQKKHDELGLPWYGTTGTSSKETVIRDKNMETVIPACCISNKQKHHLRRAANAYHEQQEEIEELTEAAGAWENEALQSRATYKLMSKTREDLTASVKRLRGVLGGLKRYDLVGEYDHFMDKRGDGDYVLFDDVEEALAKGAD